MINEALRPAEKTADWLGVIATLREQAPDIDPIVYLTEVDPDSLRPGCLREVEIVGAREYDLVARLRG